MPEPLKNRYTPAVIDRLADELEKAYLKFDKKKFRLMVFDQNWEQRELKQRMRHIAESINHSLPISYPEQIKVLNKVAPRFDGFLALIFPDFVQVYGLEDPDVSIPALEHFTQYSSSEFGVRPFIERYEKRMVKQHLLWAKNKNHHVRRLASEGIRPRLPWGMALTSFKKDPQPLLPILELLKQDESEYVRRSVANCLNDISKDHPAIVLELIKKWKDISAETDWIVKHASRGLLKKGHQEALASFGLNPAVKAEVSGLTLSKSKVKIGESFYFTFDLKLLEKREEDLRIEYKIYFMKANGKPAAKVFQIGKYALQPKETLSFERKHSFVDLTTRRHYAGEHKVVVVVNGKEKAEIDFVLKPQ
jgi:3-methyladenine DNA glycosylase AlkC